MRRRGWLRVVIVVLALALALGRGARVLFGPNGGRGSSHSSSSTITTFPSSTQTIPDASPSHFRVHDVGRSLAAPVQDAAIGALPGGRIALLGGLSEGDISSAAVTVLAAGRILSSASLPEPQHDAQAAVLGTQVYVLGGGQVSSDDHILRYDPASRQVTTAGRLPQPASDVAVAPLAGSAYAVGGFNGHEALDTIVRWRPGEAAKVVARLPFGLRYSAAAAIDGALVIAGGSQGEQGETASRQILRFDPGAGRVRKIGTLPKPLTHAAAVALGSYVYLIGGRGATQASLSSSIYAIDPHSGVVKKVGSLPQPISDEAAVSVGGLILLAGGQLEAGESSSVLTLDPRGA